MAYLRDQIRQAIRSFFAPLTLAWRLTRTVYRAMDPDADGWCEWTHPLPGYLMKCCDCGLVHEMEFVIGALYEDEMGGPLNEGESDETGVILFRARRAQ